MVFYISYREEESKRGTMWEHPDTGGHPPGPAEGWRVVRRRTVFKRPTSFPEEIATRRKGVCEIPNSVIFDATQFTLNLEPV